MMTLIMMKRSITYTVIDSCTLFELCMTKIPVVFYKMFDLGGGIADLKEISPFSKQVQCKMF